MSTLRCGSKLVRRGLCQSTRPSFVPGNGNPFRACQQSFRSLTTDNEPQSSTQTITPLREPTGQPFSGLEFARPVPVSPSYFARHSRFDDVFANLTRLLDRYQRLPVAPPDKVQRVMWRTLEHYRVATGEQVKALPFSRAMKIVKRLHAIQPAILPGEVKEALSLFQRDIDPYLNVSKPIPVDKFGRTLGVGRRKSSVARAWVVEGTGEVQVNGKPLHTAFGRVHDRESAIWALKSTERVDKYNVWALVEGGGTTGQAEALTLAIAKALLAHEPGLRPTLRKAGCITRDPRAVERKKHGHVKARKMPAWVKR